MPKTLNLNLHFEGSAEPQSVTFDYVSVMYRRVLKLKYLDKYLVQFSDLNGGTRGGKYTQIDFIGPEAEHLTRDEFAKFIKDVLQYI